MKRMSILGLAIAAAFASACTERDDQSRAAAPAATTAGPSTVPVEPDYPASPETFVDSDRTPLTPQELVGTWSTDKDCWQQTIFKADGSYSDYTGDSGRWTLSNDRLSMTRANGRSASKVDQLNAKTFAYGLPTASSSSIAAASSMGTHPRRKVDAVSSRLEPDVLRSAV